METQGAFKISEPCHENWNQMTPETQGRFCAACQKCVVDFSNKTHSEAKQIYDQQGGDVCGRMKLSQLTRQRPAIRAQLNLKNLRTRPLKSLQLFALALMAAFTFMFHAQASAQKHVMGKMAYVEPDARISGRITWDGGEPAANVTVEIRKQGAVIATTSTNDKGYYTFPGLNPGEVEVVAHGGYGAFAAETVQLSRAKAIRQDLVLYDIEIMGDMMYIPEDTIQMEEIPQPIEPEIIELRIEETMEPVTGDGLINPPTEPSQPEVPLVEREINRPEFLVDPDESIALSDFAIKVYPNPTTDLVTVWVEKPGTHNLTVKLVDVDGKLVYEGKWAAFMENRQTIDMSPLPAGVYILQLGAGQEKVARRILKI